MPIFKLSKDNYGYGILTNISTIDSYNFLPPGINFLKSNFVIVINSEYKKLVVENDKLVVKNIVRFGLWFD